MKYTGHLHLQLAYTLVWKWLLGRVGEMAFPTQLCSSTQKSVLECSVELTPPKKMHTELQSLYSFNYCETKAMSSHFQIAEQVIRLVKQTLIPDLPCAYGESLVKLEVFQIHRI